jgi:anti-sigma regulatory factor (Ser/Thr protein kinase)
MNAQKSHKAKAIRHVATEAAPSKKTTAKPYEAEKHLRKFCNVTSHELSNVLGAIVGELDFGLSSTSTVVRDRAMSVALHAAERALTLARNLRYFAVHTRLDVRPTDVAQLLLDTVELIEKELNSQKIQMTVFVEAATAAVIDSGAIQQVVMNLLTNARHAMPNGGKITLTLRQLPKTIEITVADTGVGIPNDLIDRVFEPYFSGSQSDTNIGQISESQGLGLAVSKALVDAHGGEITVESQEGMGTTFTIYLPVEEGMVRPPAYPEKRRHRRVRLTLPVELSFKGQATIQTELTMLSVGGCFVHMPDPNTMRLPELNGLVSLRIMYYQDQVLQVPRARVASVCRVGANEGIGVEFQDIDTKSRKVLAAIVKSHSS